MSLPAPKEVRDLLEDLLGRSVTVGNANPVRAEELSTTLVSVYVDDMLTLAGVIGLDLPLAVYAGAAIGLMPPGGAQDCVDEGTMTSILAENATEVCNIMAGLLNRPGSPRVRMYQTFMPGDQLPIDAASHILALGKRLDLSVEVAGYGSGRLSVALA
jgi:hypothetical protein